MQGSGAATSTIKWVCTNRRIADGEEILYHRRGCCGGEIGGVCNIVPPNRVDLADTKRRGCWFCATIADPGVHSGHTLADRIKGFTIADSLL